MGFIKTIIIFILGVVVGSFFPTQSQQLLLKAKNRIFTREKPTEEVVFVREENVQPVQAKAKTVTSKAQTVSKPVQRVQAVRRPATNQIYTVQVASFKELQQANTMVKRLVNQEYNAYVAPIDLKEKNGWYRVCVGESSTAEQAKQYLTTLKPQFKDSFIQVF